MSDHVTLREIVTNLLYPPRCLLCGTLCGWEELLCESCQKQQPQAGEFFWEPEVFGCRGILWCARYEGAFRAGMEQLKFEGVRESLPLFGGMLTEAVRQSGLLPQLTAVTYVPMPPENATGGIINPNCWRSTWPGSWDCRCGRVCWPGMAERPPTRRRAGRPASRWRRKATGPGKGSCRPVSIFCSLTTLLPPGQRWKTAPRSCWRRAPKA
mgnify:CR=1 FL=1